MQINDHKRKNSSKMDNLLSVVNTFNSGPDNESRICMLDNLQQHIYLSGPANPYMGTCFEAFCFIPKFRPKKHIIWGIKPTFKIYMGREPVAYFSVGTIFNDNKLYLELLGYNTNKQEVECNYNSFSNTCYYDLIIKVLIALYLDTIDVECKGLIVYTSQFSRRLSSRLEKMGFTKKKKMIRRGLFSGPVGTYTAWVYENAKQELEI